MINIFNKNKINLANSTLRGSKSKLAFTLAEVLITIGIIGVIAAIVIPTIVDNQEMIVSKNKFKKTLSTLNQAGKMSRAQYNVDYADVTRSGNGYSTVNELISSPSFFAIFSGTIKSYRFLGWTHEQYSHRYNMPKLADKTIASFLMELDDGTFVGIVTENGGHYDRDCHLETGEVLNETWIKSHLGCLGFIDTNGYAKPNKEVSCSDGTATSFSPDKPCIVKKDTKYITDVYPIVFHDTVVEPATNAAKAIFMN